MVGGEWYDFHKRAFTPRLCREIEVTNKRLRQLKAHISKLKNWLKEEAENTEPPTLADYIQSILSRKAQTEKSGYSQSLYNLKDAANMLNFLQANNIMDMTGPDEKFKTMIGEQQDIQGKLKPVERQDYNPDKDMGRRIHQTDRREENTQSAVSC